MAVACPPLSGRARERVRLGASGMIEAGAATRRRRGGGGLAGCRRTGWRRALTAGGREALHYPA